MSAITDYTNRDYASLVDSLLDEAALRLPEWTDRSENDIGRMLLELFAYVGDTILYYQDRIANESFLATAVERRSVIDLLGLIGYALATPSPAAVELELVARDPSVPLQVDVGAKFSTVAAEGRPAVEFAYLPASGAPLQVAPPTGTVSFTVVNASPVTSELGRSDGSANQGFVLRDEPVLLARDPFEHDGLEVEVQTGGVWERWERRESLLHSAAGDRHFVARVDEKDAAELLFGDGVYGRIPPANAPVRARYRVGGGAQGNVGPGTVTVITSGVNVPATVTNPRGAAGGEDRETIEHARRHAPGVFRSQQRAVTLEDFERLAESHPGVARARAVAPTWERTVPAGRTSAEQPSEGLVTWNYVDLIVVAEGGLDLTDELRAALVRYFDTRRMVTTIVSVRPPVFVSADVTVRVAAEPTAYAADVQARVEAALEALFALEAVEFGQPLYISKVYEAVEAVVGVDHADVLHFRGRRSYPRNQPVPSSGAGGGRLQLRPREFPRPGRIRVRMTGGLQ